MSDDLDNFAAVKVTNTAMQLVRDIAATPSRTEKERLVGELASTNLGKFVLKWAYDPLITFGLTPTRRQTSVLAGLEIGFDEALIAPLLQKLASRELTGNAAAAQIEEVMSALDVDGAELLFLILSKDLKCGIAQATITAAVPGLFPVFSVMRAHHFEAKRVKSWPVFVEPKYDGYRYTFLCRNGNGGFFSRSGIRQVAADHLVERMIETALETLAKSNNSDLRFTLNKHAGSLGRYARDDLAFMVDGEMMMPGNFNETGALRRTSEQATTAFFKAFDIMSYDDFDAVGSVGKPYKERRKLVEQFVSFADASAIQVSESYYAHSAEEVHELYEKFRARLLEGAMVKIPTGLYDKKKSYGWMKIKAEDTEDLPIVGYFNGEKDKEFEHMMGGVIVQRANCVNVRVGSGFSKELREELTKAWEHDAKILGIDPLVGFKPGFEMNLAAIRKGQQQFNLKFLGRLSEIEFHEETPDGSLRHPRHKRFRDDKAGEIESKEAA